MILYEINKYSLINIKTEYYKSQKMKFDKIDIFCKNYFK